MSDFQLTLKKYYAEGNSCYEDIAAALDKITCTSIGGKFWKVNK